VFHGVFQFRPEHADQTGLAISLNLPH
jgi:hypothetical protein